MHLLTKTTTGYHAGWLSYCINRRRLPFGNRARLPFDNRAIEVPAVLARPEKT